MHQPNAPDKTGAGRLPPGLDRRGFLRVTAGGGAAIAVAGLLPAGCAADYPQAAADGVTLVALSPKEYAVARAAAQALLPDVPVPPDRVAGVIDRELAAVGEPVLGDVKTVLVLLEHLTPLHGRFARFTRLPPDARLRYLGGWAHSRFSLRRGAFQAIKALVHFYTYADPATWPSTGFAGPWPERFRIPAYPVDFGPVA